MEKTHGSVYIGDMGKDISGMHENKVISRLTFLRGYRDRFRNQNELT